MRNPARKKNGRGRMRQSRGRERHGRPVDKVAVIQGHQDHDRAAHRIDRPDSATDTTLTHGSGARTLDRKSTRLNSSHLVISYAVFCLKKKQQNRIFYHFSAMSSMALYDVLSHDTL